MDIKSAVKAGITKIKDVWGDTVEPTKDKLTPGEQARQQQIHEVTAQSINLQITNPYASSDLTPSEQIAAAVAEVERRLPNDLMSSFALLKTIEAQPAATRQAAKIKAAVMDRVSQHCFDLQQTPPPPNACTGEHFHVINTAHHSAASKREAKLAKLKAIQYEIPAAPAGKDYTNLPPKSRPFFYVGIREHFCATRFFWATWQIAVLESFAITNPQERLRELKHEFKSATTPEAIADIQQQIALCTTPAAEDLAALQKGGSIL